MRDLTEFRRILVIKPSSLGDVVHATPCLRALRQHAPQAQILMAVEPRFAAGVRHNPHLDGLIEFRLGRPRFFPLRVWRVRRLLGGMKIDLAIDLSGNKKSAAWVLGSRSGVTAGRSHRFLPWKVPVRAGADRHAVETCLDVVAAVGATTSNPDPEIFLSAEDDARLVTLLDNLGLPDRGFLVFNPFTSRVWKEWPLERYARLMQLLSEEQSRPLVVTGGPGEVQRAETLLRLLGSGVATSLVGKLRLEEALCLYRRARLMISGDTGPLHAAAALGTRTVALFGPTHPETTGPWGPGHVVLQTKRPGVPLTRRSKTDDSYMRAIDVETVHEAVDAALGAAEGCPPG